MAITKVAALMIRDAEPGVPIYENINKISLSYTISPNSNALTAGPKTVADGVTVTISDGSTWTII